jgi:hypothetical protein
MKALAVLAVLIGVMAMMRFVSLDSVDDQRAQAVALNYAIFRNEVYLYVFNGHKIPGDIASTALSLPAGWVMMRPWKARIEAGCLYVWGAASSEEIEAARDIFWGSLAIGRADSGHLEPGHGGTTPMPAFVPEGNLASAVSVE